MEVIAEGQLGDPPETCQGGRHDCTSAATNSSGSLGSSFSTASGPGSPEELRQVIRAELTQCLETGHRGLMRSLEEVLRQLNQGHQRLQEMFQEPLDQLNQSHVGLRETLEEQRSMLRLALGVPSITSGLSQAASQASPIHSPRQSTGFDDTCLTPDTVTSVGASGASSSADAPATVFSPVRASGASSSADAPAMLCTRSLPTHTALMKLPEVWAKRTELRTEDAQRATDSVITAPRSQPSPGKALTIRWKLPTPSSEASDKFTSIAPKSSRTRGPSRLGCKKVLPRDSVDQQPSYMGKISTTSEASNNLSELAREEWSQHLQNGVKQDLRKLQLKKQRSLTHCISQRSLKLRWNFLPVPQLARLVDSKFFTWLSAIVIVVNVIVIGYGTNVSMANLLSQESAAERLELRILNGSFTVFYCCELLLRVLAQGTEFFRGIDAGWNAFDAALAIFSVVEELSSGVELGIGAFRVFRGLRMLRVLRIVRVMRYFRDLRVMISSIMQSLGALSWALLLLVTIMYLFSVVLMQGAILWLGEHGQGDTNSNVKEGLVMWYSSIQHTMYTLLASILSGVSWIEVVRPLGEISAVYQVVFCFYVVFVMVGLLNVLTGIFVERACELSSLDKELVIQSQMKRNDAFLLEMKRIFEEADTDGSGTIVWEEFKHYLQNDRVKAYLATQQLDAYDARTLFDIISEGRGDVMTIENFIVGCQRLRGMAKEVDLLAVLQETRTLRKYVKSLTQQLAGRGIRLQHPAQNHRMPHDARETHLSSALSPHSSDSETQA